ncbi:MAG: patatin-like phospholipase family protein [Hyphomonadaceae bacterium]
MASLLPPDGVRVLVDSAADLQKLERDIVGRLASPGESQHSILAMSGGGANGAYGAGVIVGWTETGRRPEFDIVTGISTGALAAPFAFLGPRWDPQLQSAYTDGATRGLLNWLNLSVLVSPSLFSSGALETLIDKSITPALLRDIAIEHSKGRSLLVVTTNLDTERAVIWDMGALAAHGDAPAVKLFRRILLASASMPGLFAPVLIAGRAADGRVIDEMHVDGTVSTPFLVVPEKLLSWKSPVSLPSASAIYVLVNGQLTPAYSIISGDLSSILDRSFDTIAKASLRASLASTAGFAKANEMSLKVAEIPVGSQASSANLDQASMRSLFELGRRRGASGEAWSGVSPDGVALVSDAPTDMSENRGGQSSSIDGPQSPDKR